MLCENPFGGTIGNQVSIPHDSHMTKESLNQFAQQTMASLFFFLFQHGSNNPKGEMPM